MSKDLERHAKSIRKTTFKKYIAIAHKDNGDDFFEV